VFFVFTARMTAVEAAFFGSAFSILINGVASSCGQPYQMRDPFWSHLLCHTTTDNSVEGLDWLR
jgi:hypothetical protein